MKTLAISSFAYRYAIGFDGFRPKSPLGADEFLRQAKALGFQGVQLCENLGIAQMTDAQLDGVGSLARELGLFIEVGMNGATEEKLYRHLEICKRLDSGFLRVVLGGKSCKNKDEAVREQLRHTDVLRAVLPMFKQARVSIGIENHFDLPTYALRQIIDAIDDENVNLIFDTTNCIHFLERPQEALEICKGRIASIHLKDYTVKKVEAGHLVAGAVLGDGELEIPGILQSCDRIVLEMTIRRSPEESIEDVLQWEQHAVVASASRLLRLAQE